MAVGFANGAVTVVRGDLINDLGAKQRTVFESEEPITGVGFRDGSKITTLYISTTARLLTLVISGKGQRQPARTLEESGCAVGCMTVDKHNGDIVVARDDAIYFYRPPGRGPVYAHEGPKNLISLYDDYTVLVSPPRSSGLAKSSGLGRFRRTQAVELFSTSTFTILDTDLKFIAHSEALSSPVKGLFVEWGDLFVLTIDGKVSALIDVVRGPGAETSLALSLPREGPAAQARDTISAESIRLGDQPSAESWHERAGTERHLPQVRGFPLLEGRL